MKKLLALILPFALTLSLAACGGSAAPAASDSAADSKASSHSSDAGEAEYVLKLGDVLAEDHPHSQSYYWFADRVKELTDGAVSVDIHVNSSLGNQADLIEGLKLGTVQIAKSMTTGLSVYCPEMQIFDLPYMFQNTDQFFKVIDGEIGEHYAKDVLGKEDMIGIAYFYAGSRSFYTNKPINSMSDIKGWKIRVPESPIFMGLCDAFDCAGTPMGVGELYTALQTGVVDGAENAPIFYYQQKHFEAAPYLTMTEHIMTPDIVVMSKSYLESMPQEYQDAIIQAGKEMMQYERELWFSQEEEALSALKDAGVTIAEVDKTEWMDSAKKVWDNFSDIVGQENIDKIQALA